MSRTVEVAAVDLGATSGRVMLASVGPDGLSLAAVHRFPNRPVRTPDGLHWNILELYAQLVDGLRTTVRRAPGLVSVGIDSWAVDYGLLAGGRLLGSPYHYRDEARAAGVEVVEQRVGRDRLYAEAGLQFLPFNTVYQLAAEPAEVLAAADRMLLLPDLLAFWLTGTAVVERTNASTTGLLDVRTGDWNEGLITDLGLPRVLFGDLVEPGTPIGPLVGSVRDQLGGGDRVTVHAVGSHDTASAVVAVPAESEHFAYVSCGTWGLVGLELHAPVVTEEARAANFTNEGGVDGTTRFLHNVMGLWLLNECVERWRDDGDDVELDDLLRAAEQVEPGRIAVFDPNDEVFLAQGDMPDRIRARCREHGLPEPDEPAVMARSILQSLATAFAETVVTAQRLSGREVRVLHVVGGGAQNRLLCQLTADLSGLPVVAGPVEATAIGNVLVQARAVGAVSGGLAELRRRVVAAGGLTTYQPAG